MIAPDTGGGFGTKVMLLYPEEVLVPFWRAIGSTPVKWVEDRDGAFRGLVPRAHADSRIELAARDDGTVARLA